MTQSSYLCVLSVTGLLPPLLAFGLPANHSLLSILHHSLVPPFRGGDGEFHAPSVLLISWGHILAVQSLFPHAGNLIFFYVFDSLNSVHCSQDSTFPLFMTCTSEGKASEQAEFSYRCCHPLNPIYTTVFFISRICFIS